MQTGRWSVLKDFVVVVLSQIAMLAIALGGIRLLTSGISPEQYGYASLVITVTVLGQGLIFGPLGNALVRFYGSAYAKGRKELYKLIEACARLYIRPIVVALLASTTQTSKQFVEWIRKPPRNWIEDYENLDHKTFSRQADWYQDYMSRAESCQCISDHSE